MIKSLLLGMKLVFKHQHDQDLQMFDLKLKRLNSVKLNDLDLLCFTELANTMKYGGGFLYNLVFTE